MFLYNDLRQLYNIGKLILCYNIISFNQAVDNDFFHILISPGLLWITIRSGFGK